MERIVLIQEGGRIGPFVFSRKKEREIKTQLPLQILPKTLNISRNLETREKCMHGIKISFSRDDKRKQYRESYILLAILKRKKKKQFLLKVQYFVKLKRNFIKN